MSDVLGTPRERLESLRDEMLKRLPGAADRDATAIGRLIKDIDNDLAKLPTPSEVSDADEIAARRAKRRAGSASSSRSNRSS